MPHAGTEEKARYGMDSSGDGVMDFEELQAYYKVKEDAEAALKMELARQEAAKAQAAAANASDYETVPNFAARRGWDGNAINEHNYAEKLTEDKAIFPFRTVSHGPMASFLESSAGSPQGNQGPRGRARNAADFYAPPRVQ